MNVEDYISSGIVESYVLGLADEAEMAEFERMSALHPEVKAAQISFEDSLQKHALLHAVAPPVHIGKEVFSQLGLKNTEGTFPRTPLTAVETNDPTPALAGSVNSRFKYLAAAATILFIASAVLNFYFFGRYKDYSTRYSNLLASQQQMAKTGEIMQAKMQSYREGLNLVNDTNTIQIRMPGTNVATSPAPSSLATVYWNKQSKDVYLHINNMPRPSSDKQYQLWALVDGKPVDAGVFDINDDIITVKMKKIPRAQAFAVTLEKRGGSEAPTMEQLYILGKV